MDERVNMIVARCVGTAADPHRLVTYGDRRDDPQPCPICGRVQIRPAQEESR